jgi:hypothetical protein
MKSIIIYFDFSKDLNTSKQIVFSYNEETQIFIFISPSSLPSKLGLASE